MTAPGAAKPGFYRDPAYLHGALDAGATWEQLAEALGVDEATARRRYREWADDQHRQWDRHARPRAWMTTSTRPRSSGRSHEVREYRLRQGRASPGLAGTCPACGHHCRPKCGQINIATGRITPAPTATRGPSR